MLCEALLFVLCSVFCLTIAYPFTYQAQINAIFPLAFFIAMLYNRIRVYRNSAMI